MVMTAAASTARTSSTRACSGVLPASLPATLVDRLAPRLPMPPNMSDEWPDQKVAAAKLTQPTRITLSSAGSPVIVQRRARTRPPQAPSMKNGVSW